MDTPHHKPSSITIGYDYSRCIIWTNAIKHRSHFDKRRICMQMTFTSVNHATSSAKRPSLQCRSIVGKNFSLLSSHSHFLWTLFRQNHHSLFIHGLRTVALLFAVKMTLALWEFTIYIVIDPITNGIKYVYICRNGVGKREWKDSVLHIN